MRRHSLFTTIASTLVFLTLMIARPAFAFIELNAFYTGETLSTGASETTSRVFLEGAIGFQIDKKGYYLVGWNYSMFSTSDQAIETTAYSSVQMGPRFIFILDKGKNWSLGLGYNLVTSATFKAGSGTEETWKGTGLKADIGYNFPLGEDFFLGLRLNYSSATYAEKLIGETTYSTVSYSKTMIYPSIYSIFIF